MDNVDNVDNEDQTEGNENIQSSDFSEHSDSSDHSDYTDHSDDREDSDYVMDEDNYVPEIDVDMENFYCNIDETAEFMGCENRDEISDTDEANKYTVTWGGGVQYEVSGPWRDQCVVNVEQMTCTCRKWELTGIPCKHAIATNWNMALNQQSSGIPEDWVHPCYRYESINSFTLHVACLLMHFHFVGWKHGRKLTQTRSHLLEVHCIGLSVLYQLLCYHQLITHKLGDQERKGESLGQRKIWCIYPRMAS